MVKLGDTLFDSQNTIQVQIQKKKNILSQSKHFFPHHDYSAFLFHSIFLSQSLLCFHAFAYSLFNLYILLPDRSLSQD